MYRTEFIDISRVASHPPPGAVNVRLGEAVKGPGGTWVPCVTKIANGGFYSSLFEVGPGRRQVCATDVCLTCADQAMLRAIELAECAAA
jgi:hypothetical protein